MSDKIKRLMSSADMKRGYSYAETSAIPNTNVRKRGIREMVENDDSYLPQRAENSPSDRKYNGPTD
jgi:hypothetical protein